MWVANRINRFVVTVRKGHLSASVETVICIFKFRYTILASLLFHTTTNFRLEMCNSLCSIISLTICLTRITDDTILWKKHLVPLRLLLYFIRFTPRIWHNHLVLSSCILFFSLATCEIFRFGCRCVYRVAYRLCISIFFILIFKEISWF